MNSPLKFAPSQAASSTGEFEQSQRVSERPLVNSEQFIEQLLKRRFREAYGVWREYMAGTQETFADALGEPYNKVKGWLSADRYRPVPQAMVALAESLAFQAKTSDLTDQQIAATVRNYCRAEAEFDQMRRRLMEAA